MRKLLCCKKNVKKIYLKFTKFLKEYEIITFISLLLSFLWIYLSYKSYFIAIPQYNEFIEKNNIPNLNWNWELEFITKDADLEKYIWMVDNYDVFFVWTKDEYKWKWEKYKSYWNIISPKNRHRIEFEIVIRENKIYSFYDFYWSREVSWSFEADIKNDWKYFIWTFRTSAANTTWYIYWKKKEIYQN